MERAQSATGCVGRTRGKGAADREGRKAMEAKRAAAEEAVKFIREGMSVGLGTGSTAYWAIRAIGARVSEGLRIKR